MKKVASDHPISRRSILSLAALGTVLQACGGGEVVTDEGPAPPEVPALPPGDGSPKPPTPPAIASHPASVSVVVGAPTTFAVSATGEGLSYQWLRDGAPIAGATGESYTLSSPAHADSNARFSVVVSNAAGTVTSNAAVLSVKFGTGITLLAGGLGGPGALNAPGTAARFDNPRGAAVDPSGNVYVADYNTLRKITPAGVVSTLAGKSDEADYVDGPGPVARFYMLGGVCCDAAGNVYVTELNGHTIRKITPAGVVSTLAGAFGQAGSSNGTGTAARFRSPSAITADAAGNLYVADTGNHLVRKVTLAGVVSTVAGSGTGSADGTGAAATFNQPEGIAFDAASGRLYVADSGNNKIRQIASGGVVTTLAGSGSSGSADGTGAAAEFQWPGGLVVVAGVLYVADRSNHSIRAVTPAGVVSTFAGKPPESGWVDGTGSAARFNMPQAVATDASGNLYVTESDNQTVRKISPTRAVSTFAGMCTQQGSTDGTGANARFDTPYAVALDAAGNAYVADAQNHTIRKVTPDGVTTTLAGAPGEFGLADGAGPAARFNWPFGIAVDGGGTVYVADNGNRLIRKISPAGVVSTLCGGASGSIDGTGAAAGFVGIGQMCLDPAGNLLVIDQHAIRRVSPAGVVTTVAGNPALGAFADGAATAARFRIPRGVAVNSAGIIFVADNGNNAIRRIAPDGTVSTFAGTAGVTGTADGVGTAARFAQPCGLATDGGGHLYVTDIASGTLRKIDTNAQVTTLFGEPGQIGVRTGLAPGAFSRPTSVASDAAGARLCVVDTMENSVLNVTLG
jgi:sugar lactone lactonase YvrE